MDDSQHLPSKDAPKPIKEAEISAESNAPRSPRRWRWIIGVVVAVAVVAAAVNGYRKGAADKAAQVEPAQITTVKTATAHLGSIGYYIEALGTVTPQATVNLYSQINGRVVAVHYVEGQMVHRGDPLIDIDPRPYEAQLKEAQGTLQHDRGVLDQAEMDFARYKDASTQQAITRQSYEDQEKIVEQYKGTVQNDIGQVEYAEVQLTYCHLVSPINGRVGLRLIDPGNTVFSGSSNSIVVITQLQPVTVVFNVAADDLDQVRSEILHRASLPVDALDRSQQRKIATGKLLTLDNQIDTSTGTVRFRGQFDNNDLALYPNQFVNARLLVKTLQNAVLIPTAAVQRNGTKAFVYVVSGDTVKMRAITELTTENDQAAVVGLNPGEVVPITGFDKLQEGSKVTIQADQSMGAQSSARQAQPSQAGSAL
jgi:multidrug efflux system membrane fusion protein